MDQIGKNQIEKSRLDDLLNILLTNNNIPENFKCLNRLEKYLVCILTHDDDGIKSLGNPLNRLEVLLHALYYVVPENAVEVLSARLEEIQE